jgi:phosphoenolpyruvate---glycerone phosphotransferase subunit DhaL
VITAVTMDAATIKQWMAEIASSVSAEKDHLIQLDSAIGDGDHGSNMTRGFEAVVTSVSGDDGASPGGLLIQAGRTLVSTVGGASGPLWGTALRRAGKSLGEETQFDAVALGKALQAALDGIVDLGAAVPGDKTMVDALDPAVKSYHRATADGLGEWAAVTAAAEAAEGGMRATIPMLARKGRASYLGERSVGHQDPGATSTALILRALEAVLAPER